jgi:hypothetical protein
MPRVQPGPCGQGETGDPQVKTAVERLLERSVPEPMSGCWLWTGSRAGRGYGHVMVNRARMPAHRAAYLAWRGRIRHGHYVCHRCDNRACINPGHLFLGTPRDNNRDAIAKGRRYQTHGERNGSAKLSAGDVIELRALRRAGWKLRELANRYGLTVAGAGQIARGTTWAHLKTGLEVKAKPYARP